MVNSGSSANLLAFFSIINPLQKNRVKFGVNIIPGLCWSTIYGLYSNKLKACICDINFNTFNLDINKL